MLNLFSKNLISILNTSWEISKHYQKDYISTREIILALVYGRDNIAKKMLLESGLFLDKISPFYGTSNTLKTKFSHDQALTPVAKKVLLEAVKIAYAYKNFFVGSEHILYACLKHQNTKAYSVLESFNVNLTGLEKKLVFIFKANQEFGALSQIFKLSEALPTKPLAPPAQKNSNLDNFCRNLNLKASAGQLDPLVGRNQEMDRLTNVLLRRNKNNPLLIGPPGVGKTALVEGLAQKINSQTVPKALANKKILVLDMASLVAGTMFRGEFESRLKQLIAEVEEDENAIIFIDEIHNIIGSGNASGGLDAANILKPALARGSFQCIGATTHDEYQKYFEQDKALVRRFQVIEIPEPSEAESFKILQGVKQVYEGFHQVKFTLGSIKETIKLSQRYLPEKFLPDKALDLIDEAAALTNSHKSISIQTKTIKEIKCRLKNVRKQKNIHTDNSEFSQALFYKGQEKRLMKQLLSLKNSEQSNPTDKARTITKEDIRTITEQITNIPITNLEEKNKKQIIGLERILGRSIFGQKEIISEVSKTIRRAKAGLSNQHRPLASLLFLGPTGVGKTELAKVIAREVFGDEKNLVKIDMSEFKQGFASSRLIGAPAGYVGYDQGGLLTEKIRHQPYSLVLFDEIEKAHPENINLLLQILEDGQLTDQKGHEVNFKNTIVVLTSNIGSRASNKNEENFGFLTAEEKKQAPVVKQENVKTTILNELTDDLPPEFLNRLDKILVFNQLVKKDLVRIIKKEIKTLAETLKNNGFKSKIEIAQNALNYLASLGEAKNLGARPIRRLVADEIGDPLAGLILEFPEHKQLDVKIKLVRNKIKINLAKKTTKVSR